MTKTLREQLIGAWTLVSYVEEPTDGSAPSYPMGENPQGLILYTPDGYMSAQLMRPDRPDFASGDWFVGTPEEFAAEATGYIAYSGPFGTEADTGQLTHTMTVSLFPKWLGQTQPRLVSIEGDVLRLSTAAPIRSGGREVTYHLIWRRAAANS
ncbi:hypothetical protein ASF49_03960 [Methylobacterium sp. Leaf104]|nr:hypothetical protein ASF49_03960 [Methylobacterium sp. Leaf104]